MDMNKFRENLEQVTGNQSKENILAEEFYTKAAGIKGVQTMSVPQKPAPDAAPSR